MDTPRGYDDPLFKRLGVGPASRLIRDEELMRLLLTGFTVKEASAQMHKGYQSCCHAARKPEFLLRLREHSGEIAKRLIDELSTSQIEMAQRLEEASAQALDEMIEMMQDLDKPSVLKLKVCQDLLDRDPKSSRTKRLDVSGNMSHQFINPAVLVHAAATARELEQFQARKEVTNGDNSPDNNADRGNGQGG
jgi:hypothetical protein